MGFWSEPTTKDEVARRAAGRRHYNAVRRFRAEMRRNSILRLLLACGWHQGRVARLLGVSESTISRDLQRMGLRTLGDAERWLRRHR